MYRTVLCVFGKSTMWVQLGFMLTPRLFWYSGSSTLTSSPHLHKSTVVSLAITGGWLILTSSAPTCPLSRSCRGSVALPSFFKVNVLLSRSRTAPRLLKTGLLIKKGTSWSTNENLNTTICPPHFTVTIKARLDHIRFPGPNRNGSFSSTTTY